MQFSIKSVWYLVVCAVLALALNSCKVAQNLPEGNTLLVKNQFVVKTKAKVAVREKMRTDITKIAAPKPNARIFGFMPVRMWLYYNATHGKKLTKFRQWIIDKVGEAPVIYDSTVVDKSKTAIENYLFNFGYFHASVSDTAITKKNRTKVIYNINTDEPWLIGEIELPKGHNGCDSIVRESHKSSVLRKGERYDITNLKSERDRIENLLRNSGYFTFNREYITFDLDTIEATHTVNIKTVINPPSDTSEHQQYRINEIYIITDFSGDVLNDTTRRDTITIGEYHIIAQKMKFTSRTIVDAIFFRKDALYKKDAETRTINRLSQLGVFKFINIDYRKPHERAGNYIDCIVYLTPAKRQSWGGTVEINVTDEGLFGTAGSISYVNKNLSKGADQLIIDASIGTLIRFPKKKKEKVQLMDFNISAGVTYYINRFIFPFKARIFTRNANPRTRIRLSYNFENRYDFNSLGDVVFLYQLHNFNASFGYEWHKYPFKQHLLNPVAIDFYLLPKTGIDFQNRINANTLLKSSFEEQVIIGPSYTFVYKNQRTNTDKKYMLFRAALETAGNVIYGGFKLASQVDKHDSLFLIANRPFAQYIRGEAEWSNYIRMDNHSLFAIRTYAGIGVPYGNSYALPFIKQFYVGGPNSLRGFLIREVGPGGYYDKQVFNPETGEKSTNVGFFNQTGDIKLETNAEIRFDIYKWFKGALFADAGNVWSIKPDARTNGNFDIKRFWSEFAVDAGAGIRLDFNFFVVRFDYGFPLRDPRRVDGKRWQFENAVAFKNGQLQLAIGYPF